LTHRLHKEQLAPVLRIVKDLPRQLLGGGIGGYTEQKLDDQPMTGQALPVSGRSRAKSPIRAGP
jgi:hypothetical protein